MKKYRFALVAFILPVLIYWWVLVGFSVGEECVGGALGNVTKIINYYFCQQQIDTGAYSWQHLPHWRLAANTWLSGNVPLWNHHQGLGIPLAANFISGAFNPLPILASSLDSLLLVHWYLVLRLSLAALGTYLCLRAMKFGSYAALAGSTLFVFSGYFVQYFSMNHHDVDLLLPWLILIVLKARNNNSLWGWGSLLVALSIFAGSPESSVFVLLLYGLFGLWQGLSLSNKGRKKYYLLFILSTLAGLAIGAVLLLPGLEYIGLSANSRAIGIGEVYQTSPKNILFWILPKIFGPFHNILTRAPQLGILNINYFGLVGSLLVLTGLVFGGISFPGILLLLLMLQYFGFLNLPLDQLPIFKETIFIKYSLGAINFLAAIQLAKGFGLWLDGKISRKKILVVLGLVIVLPLIFVSLDLIGVIGSAALWKAKATFGFFIGQTFFALGLLFLLLKKISPRMLLVLVVLELAIYTPWFGDRTWNYQIKKPDFVRFLETKQGGRIFSPDEVLYPDYASYFGLYDVRDLDALWPANYYNYIKEYIQPDLDLAWLRFTGERDHPAQRPAQYLNNPFFDQLSVKYLLTRLDLESNQLRLIYDGEVKIYESLNAYPLVRFVSRVICDDDVTGRLQQERESLLTTAVVDPVGCLPNQGLLSGQITETRFAPNSFSFTYSATTSGYLVIANTFYPGWTAEINGRGVKLEQVNGVLIGLPVPAANDASVRMSYSPRSFRLGLIISFIGLIVAVLFIVLGQRLRPPTDD